MSDTDDLPTTAPAAEDAVTLRLDTEALAALAAEAMTIATAAPARVSLNLERTGDFIDRYRLITELGQGGFGTVWLAEQNEPIRREVALKVIKAGMDSREIIARFEAERQALALMDHPNIAAVLDAGTTESGRPYFAMELVKGMPITEYCNAHRLTIRQRLELFIPVCRAVQHAHQKAILHRDLKPSNILVAEVDGKPVPKVIDFGIAKALGTSPEAALHVSLLQTQAGMIIGTPQYMSPEQAGATQDLDTRSDIYTLGVILFELLTGDTPLPHDAMHKAAIDEVLRLVRDAEPRRPSSRLLPATDAVLQTSAERSTEPAKLTRALRGDLDWITLKALEKERERRYGSAAALAQDLERHLNNEPVDAGPPSALYRFRKLVHRNRLAFSAAAIIVALLIAGIAVSTWQAVRATKAEKLSESRNLALKQQLEEAARADCMAALDLFRHGRDAEALAHVARAQTYVPESSVVSEIGVPMLSDRHFPSPLRVYPPNHWWSWRHNQFSHDGRRFASLVSGESVCVREIATDRCLFTLSPPTDRLEFISAGFSSDGRRVVTVLRGKTVAAYCEWDGASGALLTTLELPLDRTVRGQFSMEGQRTVTLSADKKVTAWDKTTGGLVYMLEAHDRVELSSDGRYLLTIDSSEVHVFDAATGRPIAALVGHQDYIWSACFSPDGQRIATTSSDRTVRVWNTQNGKLLVTLQGHELHVLEAQFSQDGQRIVTASSDTTARIWNATTGTLLATLRGHTDQVRSAEFSPDGKHVVTGGDDQTAKIWETESGSLIATLDGCDSRIMRVQFSPDKHYVLTSNGKVWLWDVQDIIQDGLSLGGKGTIIFSQDRSKALILARGYKPRVWDVVNARLLSFLLESEQMYKEWRFSPNGSSIAAISNKENGGSIQIWDCSSGKKTATLAEQKSKLTTMDFSPDGRSIVTTTEEDNRSIWNVMTGAVVATLEDPQEARNTAQQGRMWDLMSKKTCFSPDGKRFYSSYGEGGVVVWDSVTGRHVSTLHTRGGPVLSPDGKWIALVGTETGTVQLLDAMSGRKCAVLKADVQANSPWVFSNNGRLIVTGSDDTGSSTNPPHVWDTATGKLLATLNGHDGYVNGAEFTLLGNRIITTSEDRRVRIWESATGRLISILTVSPQTQGRFTPGNAIHRYNDSAALSPDGDALMTFVDGVKMKRWPLLGTSAPPPPWFADFFYLMARRKFNANGELVIMPIDDFMALRNQLETIIVTEHSRYADIARWFLTPADRRPPRPGDDLKAWAHRLNLPTSATVKQPSDAPNPREQEAGRNPDKTTMSGTSSTNSEPSANGSDALTLVDPVKHAQEKALWSRTANDIEWKANGAPSPYAGTFALPVGLATSYAVEIEFTCGAARESVGITIPVGDDRVTTCWFASNGYAGIGKIDGEDPRAASIPGTASAFTLQTGRRYTARAEVRRAPEGVDIQFIVDGTTVATYRGPTARLYYSTMWCIGAERKHVLLGTSNTATFHRATVKALDDLKAGDTSTPPTPLPAAPPPKKL